MAADVGEELTSEESRVISNALVVISKKLGLPVHEKKHRTTKDNPDYERQKAERLALPPSESIGLPVLKKRISQSYLVKSFAPELKYHFAQLCVVLNIQLESQEAVDIE